MDIQELDEKLADPEKWLQHRERVRRRMGLPPLTVAEKVKLLAEHHEPENARKWRRQLAATRKKRQPRHSKSIMEAARYIASLDSSLRPKEAWRQVASGAVAQRFGLEIDESRRLHDKSGRSVEYESFRRRYWAKARAEAQSLK